MSQEGLVSGRYAIDTSAIHAGGSGIRSRSTVVPSKRGCVFNQVRWNRAGWFDAEVRILPPSQTVRFSTLLRALDRAAFLGARNREAVRAGDMGKGLALI